MAILKRVAIFFTSPQPLSFFKKRVKLCERTVVWIINLGHEFHELKMNINLNIKKK
jgi:hypothetical protein